MKTQGALDSTISNEIDIVNYIWLNFASSIICRTIFR